MSKTKKAETTVQPGVRVEHGVSCAPGLSHRWVATELEGYGIISKQVCMNCDLVVTGKESVALYHRGRN